MSINNNLAFEIKSATLGYKDKIILSGLTSVAYHGETIAVLGRSGSGKSTLLSALSGAAVQIEGMVLVNGVDPRKAKLSVGLVPQITDEIITRLSVEEIVSLGIPRNGLFTSKSERSRAKEILEQLGLSTFATKQMYELSGGQRQRVAIARALMSSTRLLLCDEPTSGADPYLAAEIVNLLTNLSSTGTTVIIATHDLGVVLPRLSRVIGLYEGNILYDGPTKDFGDKEKLSIYGQNFIKRENI
jgi:ABC-type multidrug transport system ATPase subunit